MGNTNCVADGGEPHRANITIVNNTKYELSLDGEESCERECDHKGWKILDGKIVEGFVPPPIIKPYSTGGFAVSGRDGSAVAPKGKVFYVNSEKNLKVIFEWNSAGWSAPLSNRDASIIITGCEPAGKVLNRSPVPWNQRLEGEANANSWSYTLRPYEELAKQPPLEVSLHLEGIDQL